VWILLINDVFEDSKEGGLRAEDLDPIFDEFTLIAECFDRFSDWTIGRRLGL
jgi:hypothetical protein